MSLYSPNSGIIGKAAQVRTGMFDLINDQVNFDIADNPYIYLDAGKPASYSGTGSTWYDISGNGHNGTLGSSGVSYVASPPLHHQSGTIFFNPIVGGNNVKVDMGGSLDYGNQFTVIALVNAISRYDIQPIMLNIDPGATTEGWMVGWNRWQTSDLAFRTSVGEGTGGSNKTNVYSSNGAMANNAWRMNTWILDKTSNYTSMRSNWTWQYQNQSLGGRDFDVSGKTTTIGAYNSVSGDTGTSYPYFGRMSAIIVYKRILTEAEINRNFAFFKPRFGGSWQ